MFESRKVKFPSATGGNLAARLDLPARPRAFALFAHCFTCGKDIFAAARIAEGLTARDIAVLRFDFTGAATRSLKGIASRIACPLLVVAGKQDRVIPWQDAERLAREARGPVELVMIPDGGHVANNRGYCWRAQSADWMAERLG